MKKFLVALLALFVFAVMLPTSADAQSCRRKSTKKSSARYGTAGYQAYNRRNSRNQRPSVYRRHRNLINIGIGTGGGALLGGIMGGKKGAGWGALAGAGAATLYTYKINPKKRRYNRR
ncbi:MAG: hypothetical protein KF685_11375 [Acidobacteria bacterium]|nr:hypothetical protein [Acidobacteriota bacterium]